MTILPLQNHAIALLTTQDTISENDFAGFPVPKDMEEYRAGLVRATLDGLVDAGMLRAVAPTSTPAITSLWILTAPLGSSGQAIGVSLKTAAEIADEINAFIDAYEMDWPPANALQLTEDDLLKLCGVISTLRAEDPEEFDDDNGAGGPN